MLMLKWFIAFALVFLCTWLGLTIAYLGRANTDYIVEYAKLAVSGGGEVPATITICSLLISLVVTGLIAIVRVVWRRRRA